jgi:LDH2 family malate/lactate/ureidoglycolate dehydrogenase
MVDIMSGVLTGANHGGKVKDPFDDFTGPQNVGHLFLTLKPDLFVGKNYIKRIKENIKIIKRLPKIKGVKEIQYPGQGMSSRYKQNLKKDIVIPQNILKDLKKLNAIK